MAAAKIHGVLVNACFGEEAGENSTTETNGNQGHNIIRLIQSFILGCAKSHQM
jgi:hypothetical protein